MIDGWQAADTMKADGATGRIYTDIDAPTSTAFSKVYADYSAETNTLVLAATGHATLVKWDGAPSTVSVDGTDTSRTSGSFAGVPGTFTCTTLQTCGTSITDDNATVWTFSPQAGLNAKVDVPDAAYLSFGYWITTTGDIEDGSGPIASFAAVYGGSGTVAERSDYDELAGTATYEGDAVGWYAKTEDLGGDAAIGSGRFNADAKLTATFDAEGMDMLKGTISSFEDADGNSPLGSLQVALNEVELTQTNGAGDDPHTLVGAIGTTMAKFGDATLSGNQDTMNNWQAALFGASDSEDDAYTNKPTGVTGEFQLDYGIAALAGSFGAHMTGATEE
jgi:hypothetical protein